MKKLVKYLEQQSDNIAFLILKKQANTFTPETFHKLRVHIKKLHSLFNLIKFCSKDFKKKKSYKPFKLIFQQAGKVRELQVEETNLEKYLINHSLKDVRNKLHTDQHKATDHFFAVTKTINYSLFEKTGHKLIPFLKAIHKKQVKEYIKQVHDKVIELRKQPHLQNEQLHEMRKLLKNIQYAEKSANIQLTGKLLPGSNVLTDLLGKWHDAQVIRLHLNKLRNNKQISSRLKTQLEHVKARLALENRQLMDKISKRLAVIKNA